MIILASASPQRTKLLREAGIRHRIVPANIHESNRGASPKAIVERLAVGKAKHVARSHPGDWVLGADTLVFCRGKVIGKPKDAKDALRILKRLNGSWQKVYTGVALLKHGGPVLKGTSVSRVKARRMPDEWLIRFGAKHMDKAGAYSVQDKDDPFIEKVVGPYDNVVGLPVDLVRRLLTRARV